MNIVTLLILVLACLFFTKFISAANVGVSPANLEFKEVLRDGYAEDNLIISVDTEQSADVRVTSRGEIANWISFDENFSVSRNSPHVMTVSVTPPSDMPNGNYSGFLSIEISSQGESIKDHAVGIIRTVLDVYITVEVTDIEIIRCSTNRYSASTVEKGDDIVFKTNVTNLGNVRLRPDVVIYVWNEDQTDIVQTITTKGNEILPTTEREIEVRLNSRDMDVSQYWAEFSVLDCLSSQLLTFDVLEEGALKADGLLLNIITRKESKVGDTLPIEANFKNTGEKEVTAQFRGQITKAGQIIQILESLPITTEVGEINKFNFFFTPKEEGQYIITGRVFYSSKRTFELSTPIIISGFSIIAFSLPLIYALLIITIMVLFLKIRKERRNTLKILRKIK